jgi:hypothetical protein
MDMIAKKEFRYDGKALKPGQRFKASDRAARIFRGVGKAEDAPARTPRKQAAAGTDLLQGGQYNRADLRASGS